MSEYHTYLWQDIPRNVWDAAVAKAGRKPMKWLLVELLEDYLKGERQIPATLPQEPRTPKATSSKPRKPKVSQPEPVQAEAESPYSSREVNTF